MIRQATFDDLPGLIALIDEMRAESNYRSLSLNPEKAADNLKDLIERNCYVAVVEFDATLIGGMIGFINSPWYSDDLIGYEHGIFLKPEHRNGVTAVYLVNNFVNWCKANGVKQIRPGITTGNLNVGRIYERLGFTKTGENFLMEC